MKTLKRTLGVIFILSILTTIEIFVILSGSAWWEVPAIIGGCFVILGIWFLIFWLFD